MDSKQEIQRYELRTLLKELEDASGSGTSMVTLLIPPKQLMKANSMLRQEYAVSANIKSPAVSEPQETNQEEN